MSTFSFSENKSLFIMLRDASRTASLSQAEPESSAAISRSANERISSIIGMHS